ncbi:hypothetical protein H4W79_000235 [Nocardiopsis terrae]|uniref:DUF4129 domain-containing protein n=1 Tax=Nocardiopsis terrae TaxID=372655 RepID=A0ABR9HAF2_9ACTN|nr:hypothetical protein [Nocardiopsis terrae]MBE1456021.1 hypothetical protein [Nocardiopsis terrae]
MLLVALGYLYLFANPQVMPPWMVHVNDSGGMRFQWWAHVLMGLVGAGFYFLLRLVGDPGAGSLNNWKAIYGSARRLVPEKSPWVAEVLVKLDRAHGLGYMRRRPRSFRRRREIVAGFDDYGAEMIERIRLMRGSQSHRIRFVHRNITSQINEIGDFERRVDRFLRRHGDQQEAD